MIALAKIVMGAAMAALVAFVIIAVRPALADVLFEKKALTIDTASGPAAITVEVADTDPKRAQGLMFRKQIGDREGMLFLFDEEQMISMWMKNTYIPLDMVFIGSDWRIVHIAEKTEPFSLDIVSSGLPASRVLELGSGKAAALGLKAGDFVRYPS